MKVYICAVSYGGADEAGSLVESLLRQRHQDWELVIADNSGIDSERVKLEELSHGDSRLSYADMGSNLGYFGAASTVLESLADRGFGWFVVCNTDLRLADDLALTRLSAMQDARVGIVAPSITSLRSGGDQNPYMHKPFNRTQMARLRLQSSSIKLTQLAELFSALRKQAMLRKDVSNSTPGPTEEIYAAHGSFMAFSREYFSKGGNLKNPTFLFGEELFAAEAARLLDLTVLYVPAIAVHHQDHANIGVVRSRRVLLWHQQSARFWWEYFSGRRAFDPLEAR